VDSGRAQCFEVARELAFTATHRLRQAPRVVDDVAIPEVRRIAAETGTPVRYLISPGGGHSLHLAHWHDALPEAMKARLRYLKNVHSYVYYRGRNIEAQKEEQARGARVVQEHVLTEEHLRQVPDAEAPIVRTHPVTGRKGLFINEAHTSHIVGLPGAESDALLKEICAHIVKPEFRYEHHWRAGDLLMWDNVATQHKANFDYDLPLRRLMYRTTVRGSAPF